MENFLSCYYSIQIKLAVNWNYERVPVYAAELFKDGYADTLLISGGAAHQNDLLATHWGEETEAEHFAEIIVGEVYQKRT